MGEQGAKTLRGGKMEDVIFAGTATRGPLGRAEVQLTIDNADGALPIEYSEVTISRTLFRNGASEYAINGGVCRLLDVQELLSDSGLGREMHVIVGQGRLDSVLQASPEERRGFIEEAAGILKHRRRKEKTLRKLEAMEANLTRLSDLAGELRRQLKPLGRQAEIAREAATIAAVVRDARARLLADELAGLRAELAGHARSEQERHTERLVLQDQAENLRTPHRAARGAAALRGASTRRAASRTDSSGCRSACAACTRSTGQRLALLGENADDEGIELTTVSQAMIDDVRAEIDEIADGLGDAQDAAAEASRDVDARPRRTRRARRRHRRAERAGLGARHAHHRAARLGRGRGIRPRRRARRRRAPAARARCGARPPRGGGGGARRASIPTSCPRARPPSTPRPTSAPSARRPMPRPPSAGCASGCTPRSARVESLTAQTTALGRALDVAQRRRRARRARRRRASAASSATPSR